MSLNESWSDLKKTTFILLLEHPWFFWIAFFLLLISAALFFAYTFQFSFHEDNARYLISALIQSQAAIISIVITLTLVAIQITASHYTSRLIDIFKEYPLMWLLLLFFLISITTNIFFL